MTFEGSRIFLFRFMEALNQINYEKFENFSTMFRKIRGRPTIYTTKLWRKLFLNE